MYTLETERLLLRQRKTDDYGKFAEMHPDADVMRYFPNLMTAEESGLREPVFYRIEREQFFKNDLKNSAPIVQS